MISPNGFLDNFGNVYSIKEDGSLNSTRLLYPEGGVQF